LSSISTAVLIVHIKSDFIEGLLVSLLDIPETRNHEIPLVDSLQEDVSVSKYSELLNRNWVIIFHFLEFSDHFYEETMLLHSVVEDGLKHFVFVEEASLD
jgi:hypothetical protein